ncbi:DUF3307 domain-containing protein [Enterococcus sp. AZ103]|uniref:DUF3307 domain-containing protein n=1 Tax=Enterococcus sp. AZ103 TaxID=2774628 RepID=UPI003F2535E8
MNYLTLYILLIGAHTVGDYALQSSYIAVEKTKSLYVLFVHAMIWTTTISVMWLVFGFSLDTKIIVGILLVPHFLMDYLKAQSKIFPKIVSNKKLQLVIDQSFHYIQILIFLGLTTAH